MIGIPLLLLFLANIGSFLAKSFRYIYSRLCCRWCRIRRVVSELRDSDKLKPRILWKDEIGAEPTCRQKM
ncbi:hypothetical protein Avbf_11650 [Armadillidium vulgare]|nr:hypothetical protein Avbf_11650 [Armadillidium vulgare]